MICPHCHAHLRGKERTDYRCPRCDKGFALDPKTNDLLLHDIRLRKLANRLGGADDLRYTGTQLWYAAARKPLSRQGGSGWGCGCALAVFGFVAVSIAAGASGGNPAAIAGVLVVIALLAGLIVLRSRGRPIEMPTRREALGFDVLARWRRVYGDDPPGFVDDSDSVLPPPPPNPVAALLCYDRSVTACLAANGIPGRLGLALAKDIGALPPGVPVLVVHDASIGGCRFALTARERLAGRQVSIVGVRPRQVMNAKGAVKLRNPKVDRAALGALRAANWLDADELTWLAKGWCVPVASATPAKLITAITRAVEQSGTRAARDRHRAENIGFMTWPAR